MACPLETSAKGSGVDYFTREHRPFRTLGIGAHAVCVSRVLRLAYSYFFSASSLRMLTSPRSFPPGLLFDHRKPPIPCSSRPCARGPSDRIPARADSLPTLPRAARRARNRVWPSGACSGATSASAARGRMPPPGTPPRTYSTGSARRAPGYKPAP